VQLALQNYVVGLNSFWNLWAPALSLLVFLVGLVVWGALKRSPASRVGLTLVFVGIAAFVVSGAVDGARNVSDVNDLGSAVHSRYGVDVNYDEAVSLFNSVGNGTPVDLTVNGKTTAVVLHRSSDSTFLLETGGKELPVVG
jgi:hypothetical protein